MTLFKVEVVTISFSAVMVVTISKAAMAMILCAVEAVPISFSVAMAMTA